MKDEVELPGRGDLFGRAYEAQSAERSRCAERDWLGLAAFRAELVCEALHGRDALLSIRDQMNVRAIELIEPGAGRVPDGLAGEDEMTVETQARGQRSRDARVVRANAAAGQDSSASL